MCLLEKSPPKAGSRERQARSLEYRLKEVLLPGFMQAQVGHLRGSTPFSITTCSPPSLPPSPSPGPGPTRACMRSLCFEATSVPVVPRAVLKSISSLTGYAEMRRATQPSPWRGTPSLVYYGSWGNRQSFAVFQSLSNVPLFETLWTAACQASLYFTICWSLLRLMSIELGMPSNHLILCHPLFLLSSIFPSIRNMILLSLLFASGGQIIGTSASASVPSMNIPD